MILSDPLLFFIFLLGASLLTGCSTALQSLGRLEAKEEVKKRTHFFLFRKIQNFLFQEKGLQGFFFSLSFTKVVLQLCFALTAFFFLIFQYPFTHALQALPDHIEWDILWVLAIGVILIVISLLADFLMDLFALYKPQLYLKLFSPLASFYLLLCSPLTFTFLKILKLFFPRFVKQKPVLPSFRIRDKILEVLHDSELSPYLDPNDQKLILSVASFKERIAREVMVPRIDIFCLPSDTTIKEAAKSFVKEGYSRIPVYRESIDHIVGVLIYKDVLNIYAKAIEQKAGQEQLDALIEGLLKPVLYSPETKKISHLLQEFRSKQIHLAIVVDEYGGTEGIVTIEDILEELVGEIADEYDIDEEVMFTKIASGGWIVDARMNILDIEKELGIKIPPSPEYDTIGGYIFHRAGSIPSKGWKIHHDEFDLEILSSDERSIEKIRITPKEKDED